ncbi:MAG: hypothetical protein KDE04_25970, partial [Anaerolineales bacterium]|nr:hypothetical protein [Anaerolineales bacterium]
SSFRLDICGDLDSGDVDGNGELDWICFYEYPDGHTATFVQLAQGGSYSSWRRWSPSAMAGAFQRSRCHYFHVVDVDGDGLADRLCMYQNGAESGILVQTDGPATTGLQFGDWESWFVWSGDVLKCRDFDGAVPEVIDVNGDGLSDILCAYRYSANFMLTWIQPSSGSDYGPWAGWSPALDFDLALCDAFMAADVNRDQHTDLICAYRFPDGSTATFVQRVELYRAALPIVIR